MLAMLTMTSPPTPTEQAAVATTQPRCAILSHDLVHALLIVDIQDPHAVLTGCPVSVLPDGRNLVLISCLSRGSCMHVAGWQLHTLESASSHLPCLTACRWMCRVSSRAYGPRLQPSRRELQSRLQLDPSH